jgi:hypothetical protein
MLPAARFRSVVPLAPFARHLASTATAQTRPAASVKIGGVKIAGSLRFRLACSHSNAQSNVSLSLRRQQGDMDWGVPAFRSLVRVEQHNRLTGLMLDRANAASCH